MLVWATELPLAAHTTCDQLLALSKTWLVGSPNHSWQDKELTLHPVSEILSVQHRGQTVEIGRHTTPTDDLCGFRFAWNEEGERDWVTEIVGHKDRSSFWVSVRLHCFLRNPSLSFPRPQKPYFVRQILQQLGGGKDGGLTVSEDPIFLTREEVGKAASIISGTADNRLPVIYASSTWEGFPALDTVEMARWASGMAHVIVEPSREFSFSLARAVARRNAYDGAISIYWPGGTQRQSRFFREDYLSDRKLAHDITEKVRLALLTMRPAVQRTFEYLREVVSGAKVAQLKAAGSTEIASYIEAFDQELKSKDLRIETAEREIARLRKELHGRDYNADPMEDSLLVPGKEKSLYPGEIRDVIVTALTKARTNLVPNSRCSHVVDDLLTANPLTKTRAKIEMEIKGALSGVKDLDTKAMRILKDLGFTFSEDGKHIKAIFREDPRYMFTVSKSAGDVRSMKNLVGDILRTLF